MPFTRTPVRATRRVAIVAGLVLLVLLVGFACSARLSENRARQLLVERFDARATLTASFTHDYVHDLARRQVRQAERLLAAETVDTAAFDQVVLAFDFDAAVLLDAHGTLLCVWPGQPEILGRNMAPEYRHLRDALDGRPGVSGLVPSAARRLPIVAVAVPYETAAGRRVFSGAFATSATPLETYFGSVVSTAGGNAFLVDEAGGILARGRDDPDADALLAQVHEGVGELRSAAGRLTVASVPVEGTPWRVVLVAPSHELFVPVATGRWTNRTLLGALAGAGVLAIGLMLRLDRTTALAEHTARTDVLTALPNRRAMQEMLERAVAHGSRHAEPLVVLLVDLDHFKAINDTWDHHTGDLVLRSVAKRIHGEIRTGDVGGRWGGEEFLVLLPRTTLLQGLLVAERIRGAISSGPRGAGIEHVRVTASIGVAVLDGPDPQKLVRAADGALYEAKAAGRDRSVVARETAR